MYKGLHIHTVSSKTSFNDGHYHYYTGPTSADPNYPGHIHKLYLPTTFNDGHIHIVYNYTGPSIPVKYGHVHYYSGITSFNDGHVHYFSGITSSY